MTVPQTLVTLQPVATPGRPAKNVQMEVLEFIAKYKSLTNGKTPGARLTAHALAPVVSVSHRKVLATVKDLEKGGFVQRTGSDILITPEGFAALRRERGTEPAFGSASNALFTDVEGNNHSGSE